jgi:hypothetical protein
VISLLVVLSLSRMAAHLPLLRDTCIDTVLQQTIMTNTGQRRPCVCTFVRTADISGQIFRRAPSRYKGRFVQIVQFARQSISPSFFISVFLTFKQVDVRR